MQERHYAEDLYFEGMRLTFSNLFIQIYLFRTGVVRDSGFEF